MHMQIRCHPVKSPPDVKRLLDALAARGVRVIAMGGSDVEFGGEFAFVPHDDDEATAIKVLEEEEYPYRKVIADEDPTLRLRHITNTPEALLAFVRDVSTENLDNGRIIRDILMGVPTDDQLLSHLIPVHIYSDPIRTPATVQQGGTRAPD